MPKAKDKNPQDDSHAAEDGEQQYTSLEDVASKLSEDFNNKFGKMEKAIEAIAAAVSAKPPEPQTLKRPFVPNYEDHQTRSKAARTRSDTSAPHNPLNNTDPQAGNSTQVPARAESAAAMNAEQSQVSHLSRQRDETAAMFSTPVNNNNNIATWITDQARSLRPMSAVSLPTSTRDLKPSDDIEAQVSQILATTAHHLTSGKQITGEFPFKYVRRGHDMKRPTVNSINLQEHLWGITRMIRDESIPQNIKPQLYLHLEDVLEDACDYEWHSAVRPWSEECFGLVSEKRLTWDDTAWVQVLRTSMSRTSTARLHQQRDNYQDQGSYQARPRQGYQQPSHDQLRGGPPCPEFNNERGCSLQSGHMVSGQRMLHICSYCLTNTASVNTHPESRCRTKQKHANYHFQ